MVATTSNWFHVLGAFCGIRFNRICVLFLQTSPRDRASRLALRNKKKLGQQFVSAIRCKQPKYHTPESVTKQWGGRHARKKLRDSGRQLNQKLSLDAVTAISLFSPGVKGAYINKHGSCFEGKWSSIGARPRKDIINHMIDAMHHVAKCFCPNDPQGLVQTVCGVGTTTTVKDNYNQWSTAPVIQLMRKEYYSAKTGARCKQILSWVAATSVKRIWIKRLFGASYKSIRTAQRHALQWTPGGEVIRLSLTQKKYRESARAAYLRRWIKTNVECDPSGKNKLRRLRFLKRHSGHKVYRIDSAREVPHLKPYCRSHFYDHPLQSGISDTKLFAGLCSICNRWGQMVFLALIGLATEIYEMLKSIFPFDIDGWKNKFKTVSTYFVRGGMFQRNLKRSCSNQHWCMTFALSHPTIEEFQHECDHEHTSSDPICILRDQLWQDLHDHISDATESDNPRAIALMQSVGIVGEVTTTTVRDKLHKVRTHLNWLRRGHNKFIGHLMLDTMQSLKHFELRDQVSPSHLLQHSDYMMKLRPLMKKEGSNDFHMVMNKGDSVLVSGFSFIGTEEQMAAVHAETGDSMLHHVVTISGDTTQGGVEGYAAIFAQLSAVQKFAPQAKTISIISDAGSGFKSTACAFGLMWASHLGILPGGLKIISWLYPAAGEAKQPETDGAMPRCQVG